MAEASRHEMELGTTPTTFPPAGFKSIYPKTDGWYTQDSAGAETKFSTAADVVADVIVDGVTNVAPSQNAVFDALALKQVADPTLTALGAYNTNGFLVQTAADTFTGRTLGEGNGINISNPDGVAGAPTISVDETDVNHNALENYVANEHINHTSVDIATAATSGLQGGGSIAATRNLSLNISGLVAYDRPDFNDMWAIYDDSAAGHRKASYKFLAAVMGTLIDRGSGDSDDFLESATGGLTAAGAGTGNSTQQGTYGQDSVERALGISQCDTGTTATGRRALTSGIGSLTTGLARLRFGNRTALEQLSDGTNTFYQYIGFINNLSGEPTSGAYFRYTHSVNSGRYEAVTASGGGSPSYTVVNTGVLADTIYHVFDIEIAEDASNVKFYIDGALVATITTNIAPTSATGTFCFGYGWNLVKSAGTTAVAHSKDYYWYEQERTAAR